MAMDSIPTCNDQNEPVARYYLQLFERISASDKVLPNAFAMRLRDGEPKSCEPKELLTFSQIIYIILI